MIRWLVGQLTPMPVELRWADLRGLPRPPKTLETRIAAAVALYPCELLFVHRDAERDPPEWRVNEILTANGTNLPHVCVVPVRMQEAWLLHDEASLRQAAGRPNSREPLGLPSLGRIENLNNPKEVLHNALLVASGRTGRRVKQFNAAIAAHRLATLVNDWAPLRHLPAFQRLEADTRAALATINLQTDET
ncbi:hypothetical protein [Myxococcus xanthus]|uniref:hypothetical protein n=1 Tax=Myxococcus xanthus TaxID=34 RepID=UPI00112E828E|nr:hypothetical protein [Myxococcus xanthus]